MVCLSFFKQQCVYWFLYGLHITFQTFCEYGYTYNIPLCGLLWNVMNVWKTSQKYLLVYFPRLKISFGVCVCVFFLRFECLKDVLKMSVVFLLASLFILNFCVFYTVAAQVINIHNSIHNIIQFHNHLTQYLLCCIIIWFQI